MTPAAQRCGSVAVMTSADMTLLSTDEVCHLLGIEECRLKQPPVTASRSRRAWRLANASTPRGRVRTAGEPLLPDAGDADPPGR